MLFTIRDIENLSGIKAHTIRIWEQRYSFLKPKRSCTNIRFYNSDDLKVILNISLLNKHGYKISQIDKMSREAIFENVLSLAEAEAKTDVVVNQLLGLMVAFDEIGFEKTINKYITASGIEKAILEILFPFLDKVGILWLTNHINPAQERLVSNVIRQKIITGIDSIVSKITSSSKICLFLPEGEYHEISLLYVAFLLKKKGVPITYLGANIPLAELKTVVDVKKPDYLYTHVTTTGPGFNFEKFVASMNKEFKNIPVIISGRLTSAYVKKIPQKITFKKSLADVKEFINSL
jgi:MerR family transcriptional regulator, light-induced transcriptional regulator